MSRTNDSINATEVDSKENENKVGGPAQCSDSLEGCCLAAGCVILFSAFVPGGLYLSKALMIFIKPQIGKAEVKHLLRQQ